VTQQRTVGLATGSWSTRKVTQSVDAAPLRHNKLKIVQLKKLETLQGSKGFPSSSASFGPSPPSAPTRARLDTRSATGTGFAAQDGPAALDRSQP